MGPLDAVRLAALLRRLARAPTPGRDPRVVEERGLIAEGESGNGSGDGSGEVRCEYDLYQPRGLAPRATVVAVHGVSLHRNREPRLVHFARSLAQSGVACALPALDDLAEGSYATVDIHRLGAAVRAVSSTSGSRVGLIGFSFGGSYALVTAAREGVAEQVRFVLSMGGYHSLGQLFEGYVARENRPPSDPAELDDWIYLHLLLAHQNPDLLPDDDEDLSPRIRSLLGRYCHQSSDEEKRAFFEEHLRPLGLVDTCARRFDPMVLASLSPSGNLGGLRCRASVVHDSRDPIIPKGHAGRLYEELQLAADAGPHQLLVTSLLSHVSLGELRLGEVRRLFSALGPLISAL